MAHEDIQTTLNVWPPDRTDIEKAAEEKNGCASVMSSTRSTRSEDRIDPDRVWEDWRQAC
jgi:hypothetical protein